MPELDGDPWREAFYGFERAARSSFDRQWPNSLSILECERLVESAFAVVGRRPDLPVLVTHAHGFRRGRIARWPECFFVELPHCRCRGWTVLHECAHALFWGEGHGPRFAQTTIELWARLLGWPRAELLALADTYGVVLWAEGAAGFETVRRLT